MNMNAHEMVLPYRLAFELHILCFYQKVDFTMVTSCKYETEISEDMNIFTSLFSECLLLAAAGQFVMNSFFGIAQVVFTFL